MVPHFSKVDIKDVSSLINKMKTQEINDNLKNEINELVNRWFDVIIKEFDTAKNFINIKQNLKL